MKFRSDPQQIRGSVVPVVTPFAADGAVDHVTLARLIDWQLEHGTHGISVGGTTGEPSAQTLEEREAVMTSAARAVGDRVPFVPGTGTPNFEETVRLTAHAEAEGADAALVIVPASASQDGLFAYYDRLAKTFPALPIIVYNIPKRVGANLEAATVARLRSANENIVGLKESHKDFEHPSQVLHACGRDFLLYCGIELLSFPMLAIGGAGHVSATANLLPQEIATLYDLAAEGRWAEAQQLHYDLLAINQAIFYDTHPGPLKWAMAELGLLPSGALRPPLAAPSEQTQARLRDVLDGYPTLRLVAV